MNNRARMLLTLLLSLTVSACQNQTPQNESCQNSETTVAKGTRLTVVVDQSCRLQGQTGIRSQTRVLEADTTIQDLNNEAVADKCVIGIGSSIALKKFSADPDLNQQEHLITTNALSSAPAFFDSFSGIKNDVVVAIVDTGVDLNHEDLKENIWVNTKEIPSNEIDDDNNGYVDDVNGYNFVLKVGNANPQGGEFHGTHVAGLAAARLANGKGGSGIMGQKIKIMSLNIFSREGADTADLDNAIRYAADNHADVINLSLGGPGAASSTEQAIAYAISKGAVVVAAAGNDGILLDRNFFVTPASYGPKYRGMITVGSIDTKGEARSNFSNYSPTIVEIAAPGAVNSDEQVGLYSTVLNNRYERFGGTSMASPVVAGAAALAVGLVRSRGGKITPSLIEELLSESSRPSNVLEKVFKSGIVDVQNLYDVVNDRYPYTGATPPPTPKPTATPTPTLSPTPRPTSVPEPSPTSSPTLPTLSTECKVAP